MVLYRVLNPPVFTWYTHHALPVTPINPSSPSIKAFPPYPAFDIQTYSTLPNLSALPNPTETSVSIITPPKITMKVLQEAKELGVQGVWLQPGSFNDDVLAFAMKEFRAAVGGDGGAGSEGWCVLVDGEVSSFRVHIGGFGVGTVSWMWIPLAAAQGNLQFAQETAPEDPDFSMLTRCIESCKGCRKVFEAIAQCTRLHRSSLRQPTTLLCHTRCK